MIDLEKLLKAEPAEVLGCVQLMLGVLIGTAIKAGVHETARDLGRVSQALMGERANDELELIERCAKIAEENKDEGCSDWAQGATLAAEKIARQIRALAP